MRDDNRNIESKLSADAGPETLKFYFTPVDEPRPDRDQNPHAKKTTFVPDDVERLKAQFGADVLDVSIYANEHTVTVSKNRIVEVCQFLKKELAYNYLCDLGGIDRFVEDEDRYEVFYNLVSLSGQKRLRLKVRVDEDDMLVPSIAGVYRAANWNERECWDMFGIKFEGHPDPRRMYLPDDFEYFPLRKEFPLLGVPGSLPLPPQRPDGELTMDPFAAAHGYHPVKSFEETPADGDKAE